MMLEPMPSSAHGGEGHQHAHRQHDDGDQGAAHVQQEDRCRPRNDHQASSISVVDFSVSMARCDQLRTVVDRLYDA
jgi:hypothetical protein